MGLFSSLRSKPDPEALEAEIERIEAARWPDAGSRAIVNKYQATVGLAHVRATDPRKYLKYLGDGYFEPIPTAWWVAPLRPRHG